jgi:hypothetical protein
MHPAIFCNLASVAAILPGFGASLWALGCAECYLTSSALTGGAGHALDMGVLVLGLPPLTIFLGILLYFYRRSRAWRAQTANQLS